MENNLCTATLVGKAWNIFPTDFLQELHDMQQHKKSAAELTAWHGREVHATLYVAGLFKSGTDAPLEPNVKESYRK